MQMSKFPLVYFGHLLRSVSIHRNQCPMELGTEPMVQFFHINVILEGSV